MANEENAVVNTQPTTSETPSVLVNDNLDLVTAQGVLDSILIYKKDGSVFESKLPINPAHFGFTLQLFVDSLPVVQAATPNTLYIQRVKNDGAVVGYRLFRFNKEKGAFEKFGCTPDLVLENGPREQVARVENAPKEAPEKVFNGVVAFNKDILYKGKKLPENDEVGSIVKANPTLAGTESELTGLDIDGTKYKITEVAANPTLAGTESNLEGLQVGSTKYKVPQGTPVEANPTLAGTEANLEGLQVGETKYKVGGGGGSHCYKVTTNGNYTNFYIHSSEEITNVTELNAAVYAGKVALGHTETSYNNSKIDFVQGIWSDGTNVYLSVQQVSLSGTTSSFSSNLTNLTVTFTKIY